MPRRNISSTTSQMLLWLCSAIARTLSTSTLLHIVLKRTHSALSFIVGDEVGLTAAWFTLTGALPGAEFCCC